MAKNTKTIQARVLVAIAIGTVTIAANRVIAGPEDQINSLVKSGVVDSNPAAVECALSENSEILEPFAEINTAQADETTETTGTDESA